MIEQELTYLAKHLPEELTTCPSAKMVDVYIENGSTHPNLRIRKHGERYEITRKSPVSGGDASIQTETTIELNDIEFASLALATGRTIEKTRYRVPCGELTVEFDVFEGALAGLVLIDVEFTDEATKEAFVAPSFCLANVTQESFVAGVCSQEKRTKTSHQH